LEQKEAESEEMSELDGNINLQKLHTVPRLLQSKQESM
jgi:hypothetical protein